MSQSIITDMDNALNKLAGALESAGIQVERSNDILVQCCRCRNKHRESERIDLPDKKYAGLGVTTLVCPRCNCKSYYKIDS